MYVINSIDQKLYYLKLSCEKTQSFKIHIFTTTLHSLFNNSVKISGRIPYLTVSLLTTLYFLAFSSDIFFLAFISGASMNPARSLAPALLSGVLGNLWLYWSATFVGTSTIAFLLRKKFVNLSKGS